MGKAITKSKVLNALSLTNSFEAKLKNVSKTGSKNEQRIISRKINGKTGRKCQPRIKAGRMERGMGRGERVGRGNLEKSEVGWNGRRTVGLDSDYR